MPSLEVQLEKAEKALKALQAEVDEKKKNSYKYYFAEFVKKDPKFAEYRPIFVKLEAAEAKVRLLQDRLHNKKGGRTRRAKRGSKKTRKNETRRV
jgi:hypothetical protein